jgi:hypothetical protein
MNLLLMLKLIFSERSFLEAELAHIEELRSEGKAYQPAEEFRDEALNRIKDKRKNLLKSSVWVLFLVGSGVLVALTINKHITMPINYILTLRITSVVCLTWAVWSKLKDIETFKKETLLEQTSQYIWKFFYSLGVFLGSLSLFLEN